MAAASETPDVYLPVAVFGILAGLTLVLGGGFVLHAQWASSIQQAASEYVTVQGRIAEARWRRSAAPQGPRRFLYVKIEGDDRGYLVAEQDLPSSSRDGLGISEDQGTGLSGLVGQKALIRFEVSLREEPTPYLTELRIEGQTVFSEGTISSRFSTSLSQRLLALLGGLTVLIGVVGMGVSIHHLTVWGRYWRQHS